MKLDMELCNVSHKNGGRITRVDRIEHECAKPQEGRSQDVWYFVGDVEWHDGSKSKGLQIPPYAVCYSDDAGKASVDAIMAFLNDYLFINGDWCDHTTKHEGWYATARTQVRRRA